MIQYLNAAILNKLKSPLQIVKKIPISKLKKDQLLVKLFYTAICGSQIFEINGHRGHDKNLPHLLGHEGTGVIVNVGNIKSKFKIGDKVFLSWIGKKKNYSKIKFVHPITKKLINAGPITTFSNYTVVSDSKVFKLPKKINFKKGVLLGCALPTGVGMVMKQSKFLKKKNVLLIGCGGIGVSVILALLRIKNKNNIIVCESNKNKINFYKKFFKKIHFVDSLNEVNKNSFDYIYETSGVAKNIEKSISLLKNGGKCIFASHPKKNENIKIDPHELIKGKKIEGSWGGQINYKKDLKFLTDILHKNKFLEKLYFKNVYSLENINKAILDFKNGKNIRTLIKLN